MIPLQFLKALLYSTFSTSPSPSLSSKTSVCSSLPGTGTHHIQIPFVLDWIVEPRANPEISGIENCFLSRKIQMYHKKLKIYSEMQHIPFCFPANRFIR